MKNKGDILVSVLVFAAVAVTVLTGLVNWGATLLVGIRTTAAKEQAFQIAEAGIDYYRWHLAQYPTDYQDGTATSGPYYHNFYDKNNNLIGGYSSGYHSATSRFYKSRYYFDRNDYCK